MNARHACDTLHPEPAERLVSDDLQLLPSFRHAELAPAGRCVAAAQAAAVVRAADPHLAQLLDVRVVTTRRGADRTNHVNLRLAPAFTNAARLPPPRPRALEPALGTAGLPLPDAGALSVDHHAPPTSTTESTIREPTIDSSAPARAEVVYKARRRRDHLQDSKHAGSRFFPLRGCLFLFG
jgi:hypothetical protein